MGQTLLSSEKQAPREDVQVKRWGELAWERQREHDRAYYQRNAEKIREKHRKYYQEHREERCAHVRKKYWQKKEENPRDEKERHERLKEHRANQAVRNKVSSCKKTLNEYALAYIGRIKLLCPGRLEELYIRYPFEKYGEIYIKSNLHEYEIYPSRIEYAECYDAGVLAYLYSIHRCAALDCDYAIPYMRKMIRIYIKCALFIHNDARNLCRENNFHEMRLEAFEGNVC